MVLLTCPRFSRVLPLDQELRSKQFQNSMMWEGDVSRINCDWATYRTICQCKKRGSCYLLSLAGHLVPPSLPPAPGGCLQSSLSLSFSVRFLIFFFAKIEVFDWYRYLMDLMLSTWLWAFLGAEKSKSSQRVATA